MTRDFPRRHVLLLGLMVAVHAAWLWAFSGPVYAGADAAGYFTPARLLVTEGTTSLHPASPAEFIGYHWLDGDDGRFYVRYPPGLPLILATADSLGGSTAAQAVTRLLATLSVLLFFLLARRWVGSRLALAGTLAWVTLPVLNEQALQGFSHVPTVTCLLAGLFFVEMWRERPRPWLALLTGLFLGTLPAIRYPAVLLGLGVGLYALLGSRSSPHRRQFTYLLLGAALPISALLVYNQLVLGGPLRTAYDFTREQSSFGLAYFSRNLLGYAGTMVRNAGAIALFGTIGMAVLAAGRQHRSRGALLLGLTATVTAMYTAYYWPLTDIRFLLPILPLFLLAALCFVAGLRRGRIRRVTLMVFLGLHLLVALPDGALRMQSLGRRIERATLLIEGVALSIPTGSVIVAPHAVQTLLDPYRSWKLAEWTLLWPGQLPPPPPEVPAPINRAGERQASPFQPRKGEKLRAPYAGLEEREKYQAVMRDLLAWSRRDSIYWIAERAWIEAIRPYLDGLVRFDQMGRIPPPELDERLRRLGRQRQFWIPDLPLELYSVTPTGTSTIARPRPGAGALESDRQAPPGPSRTPS